VKRAGDVSSLGTVGRKFLLADGTLNKIIAAVKKDYAGKKILSTATPKRFRSADPRAKYEDNLDSARPRHDRCQVPHGNGDRVAGSRERGQHEPQASKE